MSTHPTGGEPPKEPPPTDPPYTGPAEPPKEPPNDGAPSGPAEPPKEPPPADPPATVAATSNATLERFEAPQAPMSGRVMRADSPSGRTEAFTGQQAEFSAPQAPGPSSDTGAP